MTHYTTKIFILRNQTEINKYFDPVLWKNYIIHTGLIEFHGIRSIQRESSSNNDISIATFEYFHIILCSKNPLVTLAIDVSIEPVLHKLRVGAFQL